MRILFLALDVDLSRNRGDSIHVLNLAKSLTNVGNVVKLVVGAATTETDDVEVSVIRAATDAKTIQHALRIARDFQPDVIYERRFSPKIAAAIAGFLRIPYVVEINGLLEEEAAMQGRSIPAGRVSDLKRIVRLSILRRASAIVAVTEGLRAAMISTCGVAPDKVHVVPNGVDADLFRPRDQGEARRNLSLPDGSIACFVGNLAPWQGVETLLEAMKVSNATFRLIVVGHGADRGKLVEMATRAGLSSRISFVGEVQHSVVPEYIAAADVCVAPKRHLRSGYSALKIYEYLACGRPLVAADVPGITEFVAKYEAGITFPPDDAEALGKAIVRVLAEPKFKDAALRASPLVREEHSWDRTARRVAETLESVVLVAPV